MKKRRNTALDFEIDRLTNSIQNTISGDRFPTEVSLLTKDDLKKVTKKNGWSFNWRIELNDNAKEVYKLTITNNPNIIQGLLSVTLETDHVFMNLAESAPFNIRKISFTKVLLEIWLLMHVKFPFKKDLTVSLPSMQRQNL